MLKKLLIFVAILTRVYHPCVVQGTEFRFDYKFNDRAKGWMKLHLIPGTWKEAMMRCHAEGAVLASPLTVQLKKAMIAFLFNQSFPPNAIFTGIHASFSKGDYTSVEGVPLSLIPITWAAGEPDNFENSESCLVMRTSDNGTMLDSRCDDVLPYICYKKFTTLSMTGCGTTDPGYEYDSRTGSCYKFHRRALTWSQAFMTCLAEGGHLAIINHAVEAAVVKEIYAKHPLANIRSTQPAATAIGFHDWGEHMTFMTIHGQTLDEAGYEVWAKGQPDNASLIRTGDAGEFCGSSFRDATLNDIWCNVPIPFLCEKSLESLLQR